MSCIDKNGLKFDKKFTRGKSCIFVENELKSDKISRAIKVLHFVEKWAKI